MKPVAILASGMVTGVGLNSASSCAAIRCAIDNFSETRFMDKGGEWIIGSQVQLEQPWRGLAKLVRMAVPAIHECLDKARGVSPEQMPLLLCVAESERPGRIDGLETRLLFEIQEALGGKFHRRSKVIPGGRVAGALAIEQASSLIEDEDVPYCIVAGVDSFLVAETLTEYEGRNRLLTSRNSNGFIPGEAGAAVLVGAPWSPRTTPQFGPPEKALYCMGIGKGFENAAIDSEDPLRADGLASAFKTAFMDSGVGFKDLDFRISDANGEQYAFKEGALGMSRTFRVRKSDFDIWHPADCVGEIGAAAAACALGVALAGHRKDYLPGPGILCHFGDDQGHRAALVLRGDSRKEN